MKKYLISRRSIIDETFEVVADDASDLCRKIQEGDVGLPVMTEWCDWHDDAYDIVQEEELDPLYVMVKKFDAQKA